MASTLGVTRTHPQAFTVSAMRRSRTPALSRFPLACGLMMTPMPGTGRSGGRARRSQLAARRLDVPSAAFPDGGSQAVLAQDVLEAQHAAARARREGRAGELVPGDEVHLRPQAVQQLHESVRVGIGVV